MNPFQGSGTRTRASRPAVEGEGSVFGEGGALLLLPVRVARIFVDHGALPTTKRAGAWGAFLTALVLFWPSTPATAQEWNSQEVLTLIAEAIEVRRSFVRDPELQSYSSQARGYVYFFLDREDTGERILVKTDQIALEVYWRAPNHTKQRIVGLRDEKTLPTNIRYHLDHLLVVQDEFGDRIRIGDGDEIEAVVHPVALRSENVYDFLLADSVTVTLPGAGEPVRVYEVQVRPKDFDQPGFVGSVYLDRATKAIVRMSFTFTPVSYVDSYLDFIQISLENGLWLGKHWLPYRQQLEIRREVPYLDVPAGSVIRGWFEIRDYEINPPLPSALFLGQRVTSVPEETRQAFPFEDSLHAHLDVEGLAPTPDMREIRSLALSIAKDQYLSGIGRLRLFLPEPMASSILRYNRAEGLFLGGGASYGLRPWAHLSLNGGFAFGRQRPSASATLRGGERAPQSGIELHWNQPRDMGPIPGISGVLNTISALSLERDYRDLFFSTGIRAFHSWSFPGRTVLSLVARREEHRSARDVVSDDLVDASFRAVLSVTEGTWTSVTAGLSTPLGAGSWLAEAEGQGGRMDGATFGSLDAGLSWRRESRTRGLEGHLDLRGGLLWGKAPLQAHFLLGGRQTLPGYLYRSQAGDRYWLFRAGGSKAVLAPWLRVRAFLSAGGTALEGDAIPPSWEVDTSSRSLFSAGLGLGLGWDVLHLDLARGISSGGGWEVILAVNHDFWPWL